MKSLNVAMGMVAVIGALAGLAGEAFRSWNDLEAQEVIWQAKSQIDDGRKCLILLLNKEANGTPVLEYELENCFRKEKGAINDLEVVADCKKCRKRVRRQALQEMILFYETSLEPTRFSNEVLRLNYDLSKL